MAENNKSEFSRVVVVMVCLCAVLSALLAVVNGFTAPKIAQIENEMKQSAYREVCPGWEIEGDEEKKDDDPLVVSSVDIRKSGGKGVILNLKGKGYGGAFVLVAAYKSDGTLLGAKMISDSETPGLGKKSEEPWYMQMFAGKDKIPVSKAELDSKYVQEVTGASVTFAGVSSSLAQGSEYAKEMLK